MSGPNGTNGTNGTAFRTGTLTAFMLLTIVDFASAPPLTRRRLKKFSIYLFRKGKRGRGRPRAISADSANSGRISRIRQRRQPGRTTVSTNLTRVMEPQS